MKLIRLASMLLTILVMLAAASLTTAQSSITLYPGFYVELPKIDYNGSYTVTLIVLSDDTYRFQVSGIGCSSSSCLFEINPEGDTRHRVDPSGTWGTFPSGDGATADYELNEGTYTLTFDYQQKLTLFSSDLQFLTIGFAPASFTQPLRSLMNGTHPALARSLQNSVLTTEIYADQSSSTYIFDGDTFELQPIDYGSVLLGGRYQPVYSPAARRLAVVESANFGMNDFGSRSWINIVNFNLARNQGITLFSPRGQTLSNSGDDDSAPSFSPDGRYLVYHSSRNGSDYEIMLFDIQTKRETALTNNPAADRYPSFSPDGAHILFHSDRDNPAYDLYVMDADGSNIQRLTTTPDGGGSYRGVYSPDGTKIAYTSDVDRVGAYSDGSFYGQIYVVNADGTAVTRLSDTSVDDYSPAWSPDGEWIAYISDQRPAAVVYAIRPDGSEEYPLLQPRSLSLLYSLTGGNPTSSAMGVSWIAWYPKS